MNHWTPRHAPSFAFLLASLLPAQATVYVVDAASGPGTHYTSLQTALGAVADGSTLIVRSGNYGAIDIVGRDVAVLGEPGATVAQLGVHNTAANQRVLVTGLLVQHFVHVGNAQGPVVLDGGDQTLTLGSPSFTGVLGVQNSAQVHLRRWRVNQATWFGNPCLVENSNAVLEQCTLTGASFVGAGQGAIHGIWARTSHVTLIDTQSYGGNGGTLYVRFPLHVAGGAAIEVWDATVHVAGASVLQGGLNSPLVGGRAAAVRSSFTYTGTALIAPSVVTSTPLTSVTTVLPLTAAVLRATNGNLGGSVTATRSGTPNTACAMLASLGVAPFAFPGIDGPIWLDPATLVLVTLGLSDGNGDLAASLPVPNLQALLGFTFVWQAADLDALGGLHLSNPSASYVF